MTGRRAPVLAAALAGLLLTACGTTLYHSASAIDEANRAPDPIQSWWRVATLPTGLRVVVYQFKGLRRAELGLTFSAGPVDDPEGKEGLAAIAAKASIRGAFGAGGATYRERLYAQGAVFSHTIDLDQLDYHVTTLPNRVAAAVDVEADRLAEPAAGVTDALVAEAKAELAWDLERGHGSAAEQRRHLVGRTLDDTPYGRRLPTPASLEAITADEVRRFLAAYLVPSRAVLVVVGGRDPLEVMNEVVGSLQRPRSGAGTAARAAPPAPGRVLVEGARRPVTATDTVTARVAKPVLWLGWPVPGAAEADGLAARAASAIAGARLEARAREDDLKQRVESLDAGLTTWDAAGAFTVRVVLKRSEDAAAVRATLTEAAAKAPGWIDAWRFPGDRLRRAFFDEVYYEAANGQVGDAAAAVRNRGHVDTPEARQARAEALDRELRPYLARWLAPGPVAAVLFVPDGKEAPAEPPAPGRASAWPTAPSEFLAAAPGPADVLKLLEPPGLDRAHREVLPGGASLAVLSREGPPFEWLRLGWSQGGQSATEGPAAEVALSQARQELRQSGCLAAAEVERLGDGAVAHAVVNTHQVPLTIESLGCWSAVRPASASDTRPRRGDLRFNDAYEAVMRGGAIPRGSPPADFGRTYLARTLRPERAAVVLAGPLQPTPDLLARLREAFGRWAPKPGQPAGPPPPAPPPPPWPAARRALVIDTPGSSQARVAIVLRIPPTSGPSLATAFTARALLEDWLTRAATPWGVEPTLSNLATDGAEFLEVRLSGPRDRTLAAAREVLAELGRLAEQGPPATVVDQARWDTARAIALALSTPSGAATALQQQVALDLPAASWEQFPASLSAVTPGMIREAFRAAAVGREGIIVTGDAATVAPALRADGMDPELLPAPPKPKKD